MLLNIIHPYVFKLIGDTLNIGPIEEFVDRDTKVKTLVEKVQKSGGKVLLHNYSDGNLIREVMHKSAFYEDPLFSFLFEEDIEKVTTTPYGVPILDKKPANIKENDWNVLLGIYTKHSELRIKTEGHETIAFIGGALERCLANAAIYFAKNSIEGYLTEEFHSGYPHGFPYRAHFIEKTFSRHLMDLTAGEYDQINHRRKNVEKILCICQ